MHRSSATIWRTARQQVELLPEPFPGMSEPAWANLAFDSHCHVSFVRVLSEIYLSNQCVAEVLSQEWRPAYRMEMEDAHMFQV